MGLTRICRDSNKIETPKENSSACFIASTAIKYAGICDSVGSAHPSVNDLWRNEGITGSESTDHLEQCLHLIQDLCSHILCGLIQHWHGQAFWEVTV